MLSCPLSGSKTWRRQQLEMNKTQRWQPGSLNPGGQKEALYIKMNHTILNYSSRKEPWISQWAGAKKKGGGGGVGEAGGGNVKVIWIQRQLNAGPSGALMEPMWVFLLERVLYIFIMSQHILIPICTLQPHAMGLDSYNPLGILLQQNMPASSSMCFILFTTMPSHPCMISWHSLQQLSEEHRVGTVILISQMKTQKNKTHTLSLWIDGASTHMVQTCCSAAGLVRNQRWSIFRYVMEINPYVHRGMSILLCGRRVLYTDAQWNYRKGWFFQIPMYLKIYTGHHSEILIQLDWNRAWVCAFFFFFFQNFPRRL